MSTHHKTPEEQKKYICAQTKKFSHENAVAVGVLCVRNGLKNMFKYNSDGARINLDDIQDEKIILQIYSQVRHKVDKNKGQFI